MKRIISLLSLLLICLSFSACEQENDDINSIRNEQEALINVQGQENEDKTESDSVSEPPTEEIQTERPSVTTAPTVCLENVYLIDSNHYNLKTGGFTDSFGNSSYNNVHYYMGLNQSHWLDDEPWSLHYLNKQYKSFSGTIVLPNKDDIDASFYVHIYADGNMIYSVNDVTKTGGKVDFNVDVTGCEQLEIRTGETSRAGYSDGFDLGIVDTVLQP